MRTILTTGLIVLLAGALSLGPRHHASPAGAAFPGANGKIAFARPSPGGPAPTATPPEYAYNLDIFTINQDGTDLTQLTHDLALDYQPAWSADGAMIAFVSTRDGNGEIYAMNADGSGQTRLTNDPADDGEPAWSPDGSKIAFTRRPPAAARDIFLMNADGSAPVNVTNLTNWEQVSAGPAWSPDGSRIAYSMSTMTTPPDICLMNPDGSEKINVTHDPAWDSSPDWSPDGSTILFWRQATFPDFRWSINVLIGGEKIEEVLGGQVEYPVWSPDGTKIAYQAGGAPVSVSRIEIANSDGSDPAVLGSPDAGNIGPVSWQPLPQSGAAAGAPPGFPDAVPGCREVLPAVPSPTEPVTGDGTALPRGGGPGGSPSGGTHPRTLWVLGAVLIAAAAAAAGLGHPARPRR